MKDNIIFAGCSFTWGQGLWSYMKSDAHVPSYEEWIFEDFELPPGSMEFKDKHRFANMVSDWLNKTPITKVENGGTDLESVNFINYLFDTNSIDNPVFPRGKYKFEDVSDIVFQTTQIARSTFSFTHNNTEFRLRSLPSRKNFDEIERIHYDSNNHMSITIEPNLRSLYEWMYDNDYEIEDVLSMMSTDITNKIENTLKYYESNGIKTHIFCWTNEYLPEFDSRPFLSERLVKLDYRDRKFYCLDELFEYNPELQMSNDSSVLHYTGNDDHPSLECHGIIANSLLKVLK